MSITTVDRLDDHALTVELSRLAGCERESTAALVAHLAEFDARRLYEGEGFSSLFKYCTTVLRLSEDSAYNRIQAARAARRFPAILERLATGGLSVTTVRLLAPHLTAGESRKAAQRGRWQRETRRRAPARDLVPAAGCGAVGSATPYPCGVAPSVPRWSHHGSGSERRMRSSVPARQRRHSGSSCADAPITPLPSGSHRARRSAPGGRALRDPVHRKRRDNREAARGAGSPRPRRAERRSRPRCSIAR